MSAPPRACPQLTLLLPAQFEHFHRAALDILWSVGLRVDAPWARQLFLQAGARVNDERVYLPAEPIEWALRQAPSKIDLFDRHGMPAFTLGKDMPTRFGIGVTALRYQDPFAAQVIPFARAHLGCVARLGQALPAFDLISTPGILHDCPPPLADLYATLELVANTIKPLVLLISEGRRLGDMFDLLETLRGNLSARPFVLIYVNPLTPLVFDCGVLDKIRLTVERKIPLIFSNYGMMGATTPISPGSTLALLLAELLAGLTLVQLLHPGAPVVLGCLPAQFDMRALLPTYGMTAYLLNLACAELIAHYGLPHCGTSGSGMGWGADPIAVGNQWLNHLTASIGKVGLVPFVGNTLGDLAFSPALIVLADEIIALARRFAHGFALDVEMAEMVEVGPAGNFMGTASTWRGYREALEESEIWPRMSLEAWLAAGEPSAEEALHMRTRQLIAHAAPPADHDEVLALGQAWIERLVGTEAQDL